MTSTLGRSARHVPTDDDDDQLDPERFRILIGTATRLPAVTLAVVATVVVTTMVVASSDLTGIYAAIAGTWLALHQVTLTIDGVSLGVLPLLPTAVLVWLAARSCGGAVDAVVESKGRPLDRQDASRITAATLVGPLAVTAVALVVMQDAAAVLPVSPPNPAAALAWVTGLYLLAAVLGIGSRVWRPLVRHYALPDWFVLAFRPAVRVLAGMFAAGGVVVVLGMLWSWSTVGDLLARGGDWTGVLGLTILSILYLPNVVVGAAAVLAGSTVDFGEVHLSLFEATGGDLPALPVLAAIPSGPAASFWPVLLAVPATVGALLGRFAADRTLQAQAAGVPVGSTDAVWTVLVAAAGAGVVTAVVVWAAGGPLGVFGIVGANWWLSGLLVFAWAGLLGVVTAQLLMWREGRLTARSLRVAAAADAAAKEAAAPRENTANTANTANAAKAAKADADESEARDDTEGEARDDTEDDGETDAAVASADAEAVDAEAVDADSSPDADDTEEDSEEDSAEDDTEDPGEDTAAAADDPESEDTTDEPEEDAGKDTDMEVADKAGKGAD